MCTQAKTEFNGWMELFAQNIISVPGDPTSKPEYISGDQNRAYPI